MSSEKKAKIAVVGAGIAGSTIALYLAELGLDVTLFEQGKSLVSGPPICHLHAGGNLYREISDEACVTLLKESIDLLRFYPNSVDYRPTVVAVPLEDSGTPQELFSRLHRLRDEYQTLIEQDPKNRVLGESSDYFKLYDRTTLEALQKEPTPIKPQNLDEWMIPVSKNIDLQRVKFPLIIVQEYGLNIFRLASTVSLALQKRENCKVLLEHKVVNIQEESKKWRVESKNRLTTNSQEFDFVINSAGFRSGKLDDMLGYPRERFVEFKAAYVSKWEECDTVWPEVIFFGERGTPQGMAQFTPYPNGYFQLHGMTKDITLFEDGLVKSSKTSAQPQLKTKFIEKIDKAWNPTDIKSRSQLAIGHLAQYIPAFKSAKVVSKPLYGAQQIPGRDEDRRTADVSFEGERYARCEIVKASSVLTMADSITQQLISLGYIDKSLYGKREFKTLAEVDEESISSYAQSLCITRNYPVSLAKRNIV